MKKSEPINIKNNDNLTTSPETNQYTPSPDTNPLNQLNAIYCINCGRIGHTLKKCKNPIISYGIILYSNINNKIKYLIVQRKDSMHYVEFLRGKYNFEEPEKIKYIFSEITKTEINKIKTKNFHKLWCDLWMITDTDIYKKEYENSKKKFYKLVDGYETKDNYIYNLDTLLEETNTNYLYPEWGFAKGRKNIKESDLDCACREFEEETNISKDDYEIIHAGPFIETYIGSNGITYKHIYYLAKTKINKSNEHIDPENRLQMLEIGKIKWVSYDDFITIIRPQYKTKLNLLKDVNDYIISIEENGFYENI